MATRRSRAAEESALERTQPRRSKSKTRRAGGLEWVGAQSQRDRESAFFVCEPYFGKGQELSISGRERTGVLGDVMDQLLDNKEGGVLQEKVAARRRRPPRHPGA